MIIEQIRRRVNYICYFTTLFLYVDYYSTYLALMVNSILGLYCLDVLLFDYLCSKRSTANKPLVASESMLAHLPWTSDVR